MPLTRNLYREDEVLAALRLSLVRGRVADALFWAQEGIESDLDVQIFQTLLSVWLHAVGVQNIPWLGWLVEALRGDLDEAAIISLTAELAKSRKDSSVFALLGCGLEPVADHVRPSPLGLTLQGLTKVETAFARAIMQGKPAFAWSLAAPLWDSGRADEILWEIQPLAVFNRIQEALGPIWSDEFQWSFRALGILMATSKKEFIGTSMPFAEPSDLAAWAERKEMPMRARRALAVPQECLYWFTERGATKATKSTETNIMGNLRHMLNRSPFWMEKGLEDTDTFDSYFTSDIPDEWSSADRQKSHGRGVVPPVPNPDHGLLFHGALRRSYGSVPSKLLWRGCEDSLRILSERWAAAPPATFEQGIHAAYEELGNPVEKWDLTPATVRIVAD